MAYKVIQLKDKKRNVIGEAFVSLEDFEAVSKYTWCKSVVRQRVNGGEQAYACGVVDGRRTMMHQYLMGKPPNTRDVIDHINHNGLDNQRSNLRFVSYSANSQNVPQKDNTTSAYIGVQKNRGKFYVTQGGVYIGVFDNETDAAKHYDKYVTLKYQGAGKTNFEPPDVTGLTLDDLNLCQRRHRSLPKHITFDKSGSKYFAARRYKGTVYTSKRVSTVQEALVELEHINQVVKNVQDKFTEEHFNTPIQRNANNDAIVPVKNYKNEIVGECIVDDEFWYDLTLYSWSDDSYGYATARVNKQTVKMHTYLMLKTHTNIDRVDHINNNRLDNRLSNLRSVNASVNAQNKKKKEGCSSKYIGVCKDKTKKWVANIYFNHKQIRLGLFENEVDAAQAYNDKAIELYGEHANLNSLSE